MDRHSSRRGGGARALRPRPTRRSRRLTIGALFAACLLLAAACSSDGDSGGGSGQASGATAGTDIPTDTVRFAFYPCCPDQNFAFVAMRKGFFKDVGITITPGPEGHHLTDPAQGTPAMQRGDFDILENFIQGYLQTLNTFGQNIPPIMFHDIFLGISILKAPDNPAKTVQDFIDEGKPFKEAAKLAVEQVRGQEIVTPAFGTVQPQQPVVYLSYAGMDYDDVKLTFVDDPKIVELATQPGRLKYAIPLGAGIIVQLIRNGWKPLIDTNIVMKNDTGSEQATKLTELVGSSGLIAQRDFIESKHDTVLRFLSAWYRTLDYISDEANRQEALSIVADTVNASQGTTLNPDDIADVYEIVDPLFPWEQQAAQLWEDPNAPFYVKRSLNAQIKSLIDNGTLPDQQYDIERFLVAEDLFQEMKALRAEADGLFQQAGNLTGDDKALADRAREQYDRFNYLDAVRFLKAALA
jgi:ABC-type nitrate/sulfonate/bicarbonate transport system substrate-binding protein